MKNKSHPGPNGAGPPVGAKPLPKFFTIDAVAERLDVSSRTVRRWISRGELVVHRMRRSVRISEADFKAFLAVHRDAN